MSIIAVTLGCLFVSILCNFLFWDRSFGVSVPIFTAVVVSLVLWLKRSSLSKSKLTLLIHLFLVAYLSACAFCYRNGLVLYAAVPTIFLGLGAMVFVGRDGYLFSNCIGMLECLIKKGFGGIGAAPRAVGKAFNNLFGVKKASRSFLKIFLGVIISVPFLVIFGGLFISTDPVFKKHLTDFFEFIWDPEIFGRGLAIFLMWYFLCGYIAMSSEEFSLQSHLDRAKPKLWFDGTIVFVFLLMNNILFLGFISVQLGYLFGGEDVIRNTSLTYAQYTHKGFYELWAAVILVSLIIIVSDYRLREKTGVIRRIVEVAWIAMILQTLVIIASGLKRIVVYEDAYGYTYLRILVGLFLLWMAGAFLLFIVKIIRGKSIAWLMSSSICLAFLFLIFVSTFSVDKYIARKNIDRYLNNSKKIDVEYLSYLSTDAYRQIERLVMETDDSVVRESASQVLAQMRTDAAKNLEHWSSWNLSLSKAKPISADGSMVYEH